MRMPRSFWIIAEPPDTAAGAMYVEHHPPAESDRLPFVLVHGGGGQGLDYLVTPDGRPGWAPLLTDRGYDVYVVDRPGHGRSAYDTDLLGPPVPTMGMDLMASLFFPPAEGPGSGTVPAPTGPRSVTPPTKPTWRRAGCSRPGRSVSSWSRRSPPGARHQAIEDAFLAAEKKESGHD